MDILTDTRLYKQPERMADITPAQNPFRSFWMGGYECCDMLNRYGQRVDLLRQSGHVQHIQQDYEALSLFNIGTVREGIQWSRVETAPYVYDWSCTDIIIDAAEKTGIQVIWDICHFGFPDDLTPLHPMFYNRFVAICKAFVVYYRQRIPHTELIITPINEVSFISWLGGEVGATSPYAKANGWNVKYNLVKAYIGAINAVRSVDPFIRILTTEPLVNIIHSSYASEEDKRAAAIAHEEQFQVTDMIAGLICPELGGSPGHLDMVGYNYYFNNQFCPAPFEMLHWLNAESDDRFVPLSQLLNKAYHRYNRPIVLSETSHPKEDRPLWIEHIGEECMKLLIKNVPLWGVCWYPVIDRPDWDETDYWHQSGIWDGSYVEGEPLKRELHQDLAASFRNTQQMLAAFQ